MNKLQRIITFIGLFVVGLMLLLPPWKYIQTINHGDRIPPRERNAGYALVFSPPSVKGHEAIREAFSVPLTRPDGKPIEIFESYYEVQLNENEPSIINKPVYLNSDKRGTASDGIYEWAERHWKKRCTLRSLTMRAFFESIGKENTPDAQRVLKRDLHALNKWESSLPSESISKIKLSSGENIPFYTPLDPPLPISPRKSKG